MNTTDPKKVVTTRIIKSDKPEKQTFSLLHLFENSAEGLVTVNLPEKSLEYEFVLNSFKGNPESSA
jgi:hypothetical protein